MTTLAKRLELGSAVILMLLLAACPPVSREATGDHGAPKVFSTIEAAVEQGKRDLLSLLQTNRQFELGFDADALKRSRPGSRSRTSTSTLNNCSRRARIRTSVS